MDATNIRSLNQTAALLKLIYERSEQQMGDGRVRARAKVDQTLRDMMRDAAALPVPDRLISLAASLESEASREAILRAQRSEGRGA